MFFEFLQISFLWELADIKTFSCKLYEYTVSL